MTTKELVAVLARITGLPHATINQYKRRFIEGGRFPCRTGAINPPITTEHVVLLLLALLADVPAKDAVTTAIHYANLCDDQGNKLGEKLTELLDSFKTPTAYAALTYHSRIEVDCGLPRALWSIETADGQHEAIFGIQDKLWADIRVRKSLTISGKCLFDLGMIIHGWPKGV
ncbi:hypothetical protein [Bradyrhizobium sp. CCGE-LA001]|uniref:hypothetical protein n=1 Tax=Bradyrhizobium sp. CCGE-LA001 TaxID=1223566 RepID=UPI0002AAA71B|nr:hypothetical protein [Bradyrhizobium sp. CCGE-LA001]AMA58890.1 hypothetical protein BCCGELA001_23190 [Bradyrhizobium sp. CCGE-LA001]